MKEPGRQVQKTNALTIHGRLNYNRKGECY